MKDRNLKSTVPGVGEVWKVNVENDVEVIVDPKGFLTKELKERGYKFKCTSLPLLEKDFSPITRTDHNRNTLLPSIYHGEINN